MARGILCVAEKPSIAKSVSQHLSGGHVNTVSPRQIDVGIGLMLDEAQYQWQPLHQELPIRLQFWSSLGSLFGDHD